MRVRHGFSMIAIFCILKISIIAEEREQPVGKFSTFLTPEWFISKAVAVQYKPVRKVANAYPLTTMLLDRDILLSFTAKWDFGSLIFVGWRVE